MHIISDFNRMFGHTRIATTVIKNKSKNLTRNEEHALLFSDTYHQHCKKIQNLAKSKTL